jgi:hypothetical protein
LGIFVVGNLQQLQQLQRLQQLQQGDIFVDFAAKAIHHEDSKDTKEKQDIRLLRYMLSA